MSMGEFELKPELCTWISQSVNETVTSSSWTKMKLYPIVKCRSDMRIIQLKGEKVVGRRIGSILYESSRLSCE